MALRLYALDPNVPIPRPVVLEFTCTADHGLFAPRPAKFVETGFITAYQAAMRAGWLDRQDGMLCPECSGKLAK